VNLETKLPSGAIVLRSVDSAHSPQTAKCEQGHVIRFTTTQYGQTVEVCPCGSKLMRPDPSIVLQKHGPHSKRTKRQKITVVCALCETEFQTNADRPGTGCSPSCRATLWRREKGAKALFLSYGKHAKGTAKPKRRAA